MNPRAGVRIAGWVVYEGNEIIFCPGCSNGLGKFGRAVRTSVRQHPGGRKADPTTETGFAFTCHRCKVRVEFAFPTTESGKRSELRSVPE